MMRFYKNFVIFNRKQADSDLAATDINTTMHAGYPKLIGNYYMVMFDTGFSRKTDEEAYREQLENAKKILDKYKIKYRIVTFKD